jgi:serine/threonine protein kinase
VFSVFILTTGSSTEKFPSLPAHTASQYSNKDQTIDGTFVETYHSLACHELVTLAAMLSYGSEDYLQLHCGDYAAKSFAQLQQCRNHTKIGYCSNLHMDENGDTALFAANLTNLLHLHMTTSGMPIDCSIQLIHQGQVHKSYFDIGWYWQDSNDSFPFAAIEYTKTSAADKVGQLRAYANIMFHTSTVPHATKDPECSRNGWIPILTIKLSRSEIIYSVVCITRAAGGIDTEALKFTEIPLVTKVFDAAELSRMMHVLYEWHLAVLRFFSSVSSDGKPSSGVREILRLPKVHERLLLDRESNHVKIHDRDGTVTIVKVYDYRSIINKSWIPEADRRSPDAYEHSALQHKWGCKWSGADPRDSLQIITYPSASGNHVPRTVGHFIVFIAELEKIHQKGIVHGDLRFSNVLFFSSGGP